MTDLKIVPNLLEPATDKDALKAQLDDWELNFGKQVVGVGLTKRNDSPQVANSVNVVANLDADQLKRLQVELVPQEAWNDQDKFKEFLAPLVDTADLVDRAVVLLGTAQVQVVVLRQSAAPPVQAPPAGRVLKGDGTWSWSAHIDGNDIVVLNAKATAFGGPSDSGDTGETASRVSTKSDPGLMGCALPMDGYAKSPKEHAALDGTPIPHMPFGVQPDGTDRPDGAHVIVTDPISKKSVTVPVIDLGPHKKTNHALDLTVAAAKVFKPNATANNFSMKLDYRIVNGARFVKA